MITPTNRLEPVLFEEGEIGKFIRGYVCAICKSDLLADFAPGRKWKALCPNCGPVLAHSYISRYQAEQIEQQVLAVKSELRLMETRQRSVK